VRIKTETSVGVFILLAIGAFLYMSFQIGVWRLDTASYAQYMVFFRDVSGLSKKADIRIAGVKVGWVEAVDLLGADARVRTTIMVLKAYQLHSDAYGIVRQDGLLGTKYIELVPGDPRLPTIPPNSSLTRPSQDAVSVDEILFKLQGMMQNLESVSISLKEVLGGDAGAERLESAIKGFTSAADQIAGFTKNLDGMFQRNENALDDIIVNVRTLTKDLKSEIPETTREIRESISRISESVERDLDHLTNQFETSAGPLNDVMEKINRGDGVLGKLITDKQMSHDVKVAVDGVKKYFNLIDKLAIEFDAHGESMYGLGNKINFRDSKGYFNINIYPQEDYFYRLGIVGAYSGYVNRWNEYRVWRDSEGYPIKPENLDLSGRDQLRFSPQFDLQSRRQDGVLYTAQFGKVFDPFTFRFGLFDSTFGVGVDLAVPLNDDRVSWTTTFEAYDFMGRNRIDDKRIHLKWLNRFDFAQNLYVILGADDFISRTNRNAIFGMGINFADDDVKYLISRVGMPG